MQSALYVYVSSKSLTSSKTNSVCRLLLCDFFCWPSKYSLAFISARTNLFHLSFSNCWNESFVGISLTISSLCGIESCPVSQEKFKASVKLSERSIQRLHNSAGPGVLSEAMVFRACRHFFLPTSQIDTINMRSV